MELRQSEWRARISERNTIPSRVEAIPSKWDTSVSETIAMPNEWEVAKMLRADLAEARS